jgi:hypothetical protein
MRRFASVAVMAITAYFLIATSQAPCQATAESVMVTSRTTCGPDTPVTVSIDRSCNITVTPDGSGLPRRGGTTFRDSPMGLISRQLYLQPSPDGGAERNCVLFPNDAGSGWDVECTASCDADGGSCECTGTLTP